MPVRSRTRHVGVLVETDDTWGRCVVEAVCRYAQSVGWTLLLAPRDEQGRLRLPKVWNGCGVIASLRSRTMVRHLKSLKLPVIDVAMMVKKEDWFARVLYRLLPRAQTSLPFSPSWRHR